MYFFFWVTGQRSLMASGTKLNLQSKETKWGCEGVQQGFGFEFGVSHFREVVFLLFQAWRNMVTSGRRYLSAYF
jgi:hypothetical protein